ncbi:MAG: hypothetical protein KGD64_14460 [Candidatus Heimdallarchaeota archaeon]|nr:hypothetical protein [Candidatus Heimdallarchaeota archaeon]
MHRHRSRQRNRFVGIIPFILLIIGAVIFLRYYLGYIPYISWTFSPIVIIIIIVFILRGLSYRSRIRQKNHEESAVRTHSPYRQYEPTVVKREEENFTSTVQYQYRNSYEMQFCNFCGIKLESEEQSFCVNCGQRIN